MRSYWSSRRLNVHQHIYSIKLAIRKLFLFKNYATDELDATDLEWSRFRWGFRGGWVRYVRYSVLKPRPWFHFYLGLSNFSYISSTQRNVIEL